MNPIHSSRTGDTGKRVLPVFRDCGTGIFRGWRRGFTLLEVLIAMAIIAVGLIALVTLFPVGLRSSRLAGDFTTASFIAQQALDNIRASAQVYEASDIFFDNTYHEKHKFRHRTNNTNKNGLGYYELPVSAVKGYLSPIRFPTEPVTAQTWTITITDLGPPPTFTVTGSRSGTQPTAGNIGFVYTSDRNEIQFGIYDNPSGSVEIAAVYDVDYDINLPLFDEDGSPSVPSHQQEYDDFLVEDKIDIHVELVGGVPYYWYAMRAPVTEDLDLDGILDGRMPNGITVRSSPHNQVQEDIGLDLVPDFYDTDMRIIGAGTAGYQAGLDRPGEFGTVAYPADPHGDNRHPYNTATGWWGLATINPNGTEGNGKIDAQPDDFIQNVTVVVGWREGGQDRAATFTAAIPNQFR